MTFKFFLLLARTSEHKKKSNLTWVNMCLGSFLTFSPYIFHFGFPRHQNFGNGVKEAFPSPKYLNRSVLTIDSSISKALLPEITDTIPEIDTIQTFPTIIVRTLLCSCLNLIPGFFSVCCYVMFS